MCGVRKLTRAAYVNQRMTLVVKLRQSIKKKRNTMSCATWSNPCGVFSSLMFLQGRLAMPYNRRCDCKHATLLFPQWSSSFVVREKGNKC